MEEDRLGRSHSHQFFVHLVRKKKFDPFLPDIIAFSHRHPNVGVNDVNPGNAFAEVFGLGDFRSRCFCYFPAFFRQFRALPERFRRDGAEVEAHFGGANHEGIAHVVAGIAEIGEFNAPEMSEMFPNRKKIGEHLRRMIEIGEAVPNRDAGIAGKDFRSFLREAAELDAVIEAAEQARRVLDAFVLSHLRGRGAQISHVHSQVIGRKLKGTT